jgi:hypothetical protein
MFIMQLGSIELLYVNAQPLYKGKYYKAKNLEKVMQSVLALLEGRRVSLGEASRRLSPKCSLLKSGVRTYMECHA